MTASASEVFAHLVNWQTHLRQHPDLDERTRYGLSAAASVIVTHWANCDPGPPAAARLAQLAAHGATEVADRIRAASAGGTPVVLAGRFVDFTLFPTTAVRGEWALQLTEDGTQPGPSHVQAVCQAITCALNGDQPAAVDVLTALRRTGGFGALCEVLVDLAELAASLTCPERAR